MADSTDSAGAWLTVSLRPSRERITSAQHGLLARRYRLRKALTAYAFLAPNFFFFTIFLLYPVVRTFFYSFVSGGLLTPQHFVGLYHWEQLPSVSTAMTAFQNSFFYAALAIPSMLVVGMVVALILQRVRSAGPFFRAFIYFPTLAPPVVAALIWLFVIHPDFGVFNLGIRALGGQTVNFLSFNLALPSVAALEVWRSIGYWSIFFLAALLGLPKELYEAAHLDGTNAWQRFWHLTLPLMRPVLLYAIVLATIYNLQIFDTVFVMTDGGPGNATATVVWYIYKALFVFDNVGLSAVVSFTLLAIILALTLIEMRILRPKAMK